MKYLVEYTYTVEVEAENAHEAWEKADKEVSGMTMANDAYVYIDGDLMN